MSSSQHFPNMFFYDFFFMYGSKIFVYLYIFLHACLRVCVCVFVRMCSHAWLHMWLEQTPTLVALSVCPMQTFCECVPSSSQLKHRWSDSETARETPAKVRPRPPTVTTDALCNTQADACEHRHMPLFRGYIYISECPHCDSCIMLSKDIAFCQFIQHL